ncbi:MAG: PTS transporter subunit EIIC [Culicoidibacterales bacterium]
MKLIIDFLEKGKPTFEKISNNPYLRAIRDGFISLIPIVLFSSIFLLVAFVPNIWGYELPEQWVASLMKAYSYSMGILGLLMSATVSKGLAEAFNTKLPKTQQINVTSVMTAAIVGFLLIGISSVSSEKGTGLLTDFMGTKGLLASFVVAFITVNIYRFCVARNIKIKMPEEVPPNISQTFADLIPLAATIIFFWVFDIVFRMYVPAGFTSWIIELFKPIFTAADGYLGLALIFGAMAFFWFVGIHGPSIVEPAVSAIYLTNVAVNLELFQKGEQATNVLSQGTQYFVATLGGTGATLIITVMIAFLAKSKQLKAIGRSSMVPVLFGVNEPVLFGIPLVLNPIFMIPFILIPILNVWLFKFFVGLGMNSFIYNLPWTTPGPLGLIMGTGFAPLAFVLMGLILALDFVVYYPFFKYYDKQLVLQEATNSQQAQEAKIVVNAKDVNKKAVLVICANGATSGMLANAIAKGAAHAGVEMETTAMAYGQHRAVISQFDLIILAPQMASMLQELQGETASYGIKSVSTSGAEYVALTRNPEDALAFVYQKLTEGEVV